MGVVGTYQQVFGWITGLGFEGTKISQVLSISELVGDTGSLSVRSAREKCPGSASCRGSERGSGYRYQGYSNSRVQTQYVEHTYPRYVKLPLTIAFASVLDNPIRVTGFEIPGDGL